METYSHALQILLLPSRPFPSLPFTLQTTELVHFPHLSFPWSLLLSLHSSSYPSSSSIQLHLHSLWHVGPQNWHHALVQYYTPCLPPVHAAPSWGNRDHAFVSTKKTPLSKAMSTLRIARRLPLLVGSPLLPVDFMWSRIVRAFLKLWSRNGTYSPPV